jgi:MFS family permease
MAMYATTFIISTLRLTVVFTVFGKCWVPKSYTYRNLVNTISKFFYGWVIGMSFLGIGTALVYPTLLAAISDVAHPKWRATSLGVYRFWRDLGFVFGAIGIGFVADVFSINAAIQLVSWLAFGSGIIVIICMRETKKTR